MADLEKSDMERQVKAALMTALRRIISAIDQYWLTGYDQILESLEKLTGSFVRYPEAKPEIVKSGLETRLRNAVQDAANLITISVPTALMLTQSVSTYFSN
ncbi:hypothetical protein HNQ50_001969 [Silvimonas terrae]|uniref:Uncharacterized protein n=1 Tax=Silvimonas terrae TaxID=300266 RepID=A0A840RFW3_9NEIS|nr:hypothetical protein [Silvimonas terrae]MBB5191246.1 hypothetical protein [Silvimonas terrae]